MKLILTFVVLAGILSDAYAQCEPKECSKGYYWMGDDICECFLICDYIMECKPGYDWDFIECGCIEKCPGTTCYDNYNLTDTCECQCGITQENCESYEIFEPSSCVCYPDWGCDIIMECDPGYDWNSNVCRCTERCPGTTCYDNYNLTETCECQCGISQENCESHEIFEPSSCVCYPNWGCDYIMECKPGYEWNFNECGCIEKCPGTTCYDNYNLTDNCECQCGISQENCESYEIFEPSNCVCYPNWGCDYIMICEPGYRWDTGVCGCVVACPDVFCPGSGIPNSETCFCECNSTDIEACIGPMEYYDSDFCECRRHPCDPPWPCPEGETIDWNICNCAPDPNYSSTEPPKDSSPSESSKSSESEGEPKIKDHKKERCVKVQ